MTDTLEVLVPDLGDIKDVPVIEVLARVGAEVRIDETLAVLETEKATMDVPSTAAGKVREVRIKVGDKVSKGSVLVLLESVSSPVVNANGKGKAISASPSEAPGFTRLAVAAPTHASAATLFRQSQPTELPHASPAIRRFAREFGVELSRVQGSGPKGRILQSDLRQFVNSALTAQSSAQPSSLAGALNLSWPEIDFSRFGPIERVSLSKIKKISATNLTRNAILIPHVTNFDEADITELEAFRIEVNTRQELDKAIKLTMLAFLIKASVYALRLHPSFNASLDGDELILKRYFHIGFAADTPNGLVVPVIRDADTKGLVALAAEVSELAGKARDGKLQPAEMQGGCFTVSSLGGIGGTGFTPIINAPEVAILGAARGRMQPMWNGESFAPRLILPISLSWDHRVIDGAAAARFLVTLTSILGDFRRALL